MPRSEVCKNCCPKGGALFQEDFGRYPHVKTKEWMEEPAWVKVCANCGHYKLKRKSPVRLSFDDIIALPDDSKLRNKRERAIFHAFAEAGAWVQYQSICKAYEEECRKRGIEKFPILMHWAYNTFHYDKLATHFRKMPAREINHHIHSMKSDAERAQAMWAKDFLAREAA